MVKYQSEIQKDQISLIFNSLADPTRRAILERLASKEQTVNEIAQPFKISLPAISKHLKILENAHLIERTKQGREYHIRLQPQALKTVSEYISFYRKFWNTQLDNLEQFLKKGGERK